MTRLATLIFVLIYGSFIFQYRSTALAESEKEPIRATVCEISTSPNRFAGKKIMVSGRFESDGIERSVITDDSCSDSGISVSTPTHFIGEDKLKEALMVGKPGTLDKIIIGTFLGTFRWDPKGDPKRIIVVSEVRNLSFSIKQN